MQQSSAWQTLEQIAGEASRPNCVNLLKINAGEVAEWLKAAVC
jgi:hypothetical protein